MRCTDALRGLLATGLIVGLAAGAGGSDPTAQLLEDLRVIVEERAREYNCSFSAAVKIPGLAAPLAVASGMGASAETKFAWGSITKMWTGASIMQLVASGAFKLDAPAAPLIDAQLAAMKAGPFPGMSFARLADLWGPNVSRVTVRNLLAMQSGIPDFDTANPSPSGVSTDPLRAEIYKNAGADYTVPTLMSKPWVVTHNLTSEPGQGFHYSSTNFELLGLILAHHAGVADYQEVNQSAFLPNAFAGIVGDIVWAQRGSPRDHGVAPGYDRTTYNGQDPNKTGGVDVEDVHGVFAGWSAADFVATPRAAAELGYALWGKPSTLVPKQYRDLMVPHGNFPTGFYGLAAQNVGLMGITGDKDPTYGHLGATYGYDSIFGYSAALDIGIAVATNIETPSQTQPSDAFCRLYNRVKDYMQDQPARKCTYTTEGYYGGLCKCVSVAQAVMV